MPDDNITPFGSPPDPEDINEETDDTGEEESRNVPRVSKLIHDTSMDSVILNITDRIDEYRATRTSINEAVTAELKKYEAQGLDRDAMKLLIKMREWSPEKRKIFDLSMKIGRRALQFPEQLDIFEDGEQHDAA